MNKDKEDVLIEFLVLANKVSKIATRQDLSWDSKFKIIFSDEVWGRLHKLTEANHLRVGTFENETKN